MQLGLHLRVPRPVLLRRRGNHNHVHHHDHNRRRNHHYNCSANNHYDRPYNDHDNHAAELLMWRRLVAHVQFGLLQQRRLLRMGWCDLLGYGSANHVHHDHSAAHGLTAIENI